MLEKINCFLSYICILFFISIKIQGEDFIDIELNHTGTSTIITLLKNVPCTKENGFIKILKTDWDNTWDQNQGDTPYQINFSSSREVKQQDDCYLFPKEGRYFGDKILTHGQVVKKRNAVLINNKGKGSSVYIPQSIPFKQGNILAVKFEYVIHGGDEKPNGGKNPYFIFESEKEPGSSIFHDASSIIITGKENLEDNQDGEVTNKSLYFIKYFTKTNFFIAFLLSLLGLSSYQAGWWKIFRSAS